MMNTVLRDSSCWTDTFHSSHSGAWIVPTNAPIDGALKCTPVGRAAPIWLKLSLIENALADACHVAGAPLGSKGRTPETLSALLILKDTDEGGLPSRLSTSPAAGLS